MVKRGLAAGAMALFCLAAFFPGKAEAVWGIPDEVPAATLVIPLLETGISSEHNTLIDAQNTCNENLTLHWEIWDVQGQSVDLFGNASVGNFAAWVNDFKNILNTATQAQKTQLTDGSFYRGFMTIDVVTGNTNNRPTAESYPFSARNCLKGVVYFVRLSEGAATAIPAIHIEGGVTGVSSNVRGFYQDRDDREEIDNHARYYAELATRGLDIEDDDAALDRVISRVFLSPALNGASRIVVWAWGPPAWGSQGPGDGSRGPFTLQRRNEAGAVVASSSANLDRIVNIIDVTGTENGEVWLLNLPEDFNVYAFSFNSAEGSAALTWEVALPSTIVAEPLP